MGRSCLVVQRNRGSFLSKGFEVISDACWVPSPAGTVGGVGPNLVAFRDLAAAQHALLVSSQKPVKANCG